MSQKNKIEVLMMRNVDLVTLLKWLVKQPLKGDKSRLRTSFIRLGNDRFIEVEQKRIELLQKYAKKNEKGEPSLIRREDGVESYDVSPEGLKSVELEFRDYMVEDFGIEVTKENVKAINYVGDLLKKTPYEFMGSEAEDYDAWCKAFENVDCESCK